MVRNIGRRITGGMCMQNISDKTEGTGRKHRNQTNCTNRIETYEIEKGGQIWIEWKREEKQRN